MINPSTQLQPVLASSARTTSGYSNWYNVSEWSRITFYLNITAISGSIPLMNVKLQESPDQSTIYDLTEEMESLEINETGNYRLSTDEHAKYVRLNYTISGTSASFTFKADFMGRY